MKDCINSENKTAKDIMMYYFRDCDLEHHKGCLAPNCFTCLDSRFQMMLMDLFPDKYAKKTVNKNAHMQLVYLAVFYPHELGSGYTVEFPDLPGCVTQGESFEEALAMAKDAAYGWILSTIEDGESVPLPSDSVDLTQFEDVALVGKILINVEVQNGENQNKKN